MKLREINLDRVGLLTAAIGLGSAAVSAIAGVGDPLGVLAGGVFATGNFYLIRTLVSRLIRPAADSRSTAFLLFVKFVLLLALIAGVLFQLPISPASFGFGASAVVFAIVLEGVVLGAVLPDSPADEAR
ncbi:MAG: hypothetical protein HY899_11750 [Deltaproteobacteria bacterium]|nr:hypothetical protein [Deltaproteobacteria bacterium]